MQRLTRTSLALVLLAGAGCGDEVGVAVSRGVLDAERTVDFGDVQRGVAMPYVLEVGNTGTGAFEVTRITVSDSIRVEQQYIFSVPTDRFLVQGNEIHPLELSFQPLATTEGPVSAYFEMHTDIRGEDDQLVVVRVDLTGRGVDSGLIVEPNPIAFERVLVGTSKTLQVRIENALAVPVDVKTPLDNEGKAVLTNQSGLGIFELLSPTEENGSLLVDRDPLGAGEAITVDVRYIPDPSTEGRADSGEWILSNCDDPLCNQVVRLSGVGTNVAIECDPAGIDFEDVNPGVTVTRLTRCTNIASETVNVTGWSLKAGSDPELTVQSYDGNPAALGPGERFEVEVQFSPTLAGVGTLKNGVLEIRGRNPRANRDLTPTEVALVGQAGGPDIAVSPTQLGFGRIGVGLTAKRQILVENVGYSALTVTSINGDVLGTNVFTADRTAFNIPPGGAEVITITYAPLDEAIHSTEVLIVSDDADEMEIRIPVDGEGADLPPCSYTVTPENVNFGIVEVLRSTTQGIRIENIGTNDCLINDIRVDFTSSPAFTLPNGEETNITLTPGGSHTVIVQYMPGADGADDGFLTFNISDPNRPTPEIALRGTGATSALLISPDELDFGVIGVGCNTADRRVTVYNTGASTTRIERIEIPMGVSTEFTIGNLPAGVPSPPGAGAQIAPGQSIEFDVRYHANDQGTDLGFMHLFELGRSDPYVIPLYGEGSDNPVNEDTFVQLETPEVDLLFIVDNSCSMSEEQASLAANFSSFIQFAEAQALDYRLAVVSTDIEAGFPGARCPSPLLPDRASGLAQGACGYFADGGVTGQANPAWRLVSPDEQPSPEAAFSAIVNQGTDGSGVEQGLQAAYQALSAPLITGWNAGFLRPDAYLALIFISDEDDQSPGSVDFFANYFQAIKGFRNSNLFSASAIVGDKDVGCSTADAGNRYIDVADQTGGISQSICTQDWATALQNLGLAVFGYKSRFFMTNRPVPGTVQIFVDGVEVDSVAVSGQVRWTYDAQTNSVSFAPLAVPEPGSEIVVRYQAQCL